MRDCLKVVSGSLAIVASLAACSAVHSSHPSKDVTPQVALPALMRPYEAVDGELQPYKWSNNDNTQEPNTYVVPKGSASVMVHVTYSSIPGIGKRVNDVVFRELDNALVGTIKKAYIPHDSVKRSLSSIGGNLQEIYDNASPAQPGEATSFFFSASLAWQERRLHVPSCAADSGQHGLLMVDVAKDGVGTVTLDINDAALSYCEHNL